MKKIVFTLLLFPLFIQAQVGINTTTPDASSMLDINATDKGLLIPRVSIPNLNAASPITAPAISLLVYNTNTTTGAGFYYWDGTKWTPFTGGTSHWTKVGNDIYNNNTANVGVGTTTPTTKFHIENIGAPGSLLNQNFETNTITPLTTGGSANWATQTTEKFAGTYAAKSGTIADSQTTQMSHTIVIPASGATLSFYYNVSSEVGYDYLRFYIDGVQQNQWSGAIGWTQQSYILAAGSRTLRWEYSKDSSSSSGTDAAYIDNITIATAAPAAMRIVDGNQATGKVLTSDVSGNASWQSITNSSISDIPIMASVQGMIIPICNDVSVGTTGSFSTTIKGVPTTVSWEVLARQQKSASQLVSGNQLARAEVLAERLQVRYDFSPQLPFNPNGFIFSANNNSGHPDVFVLNYANKSQSSVTINIARVERFAEQSGANCWTGQFYFDAFITN
ncbi:hypothetical protein G6N05_14205 [Flavobacterium sp. F372]|uniref:Uncharacterized protein n=1 Tax=Flavobacterium bernardetii TaxID=2813823 RepID=A0ABR7J1S9_9FLAO|nr:hypothetical protein [Flavobacterium bernardetii]MBC5835996.1 hypothetical protein [Flavobacterium bernardetii]NHF71264.1 hypothetical protein [Flavobacterium bernardetii]